MDMNKQAALIRIEELIESEQYAILATVSRDNAPRVRFMSPTILQGRRGILYALTYSKSAKVNDIRSHRRVEWLFHSANYGEVFHVRGTADILDIPELKAEIIEAVAGRLGNFWRANPDPSEFVAIETVIEHIIYFQPQSGTKTFITMSDD